MLSVQNEVCIIMAGSRLEVKTKSVLSKLEDYGEYIVKQELFDIL